MKTLSVLERPRALIERVANNLLIRLLVAVISTITAYLEFATHGLTLVFFILVGLVLFVTLVIGISLINQWIQEQRRILIEKTRLYYDRQSKIETLSTLINEFETIEKTKMLAERVRENATIQMLAILPIENEIGIVVNIGQEEKVEVGTQLLIYRIDEYMSDGQHLERPIALASIKYIQAGNNCSQAIITARLDSEFWDQITMRLQKEKMISPPRNFVVPYVPQGLNDLSIENLITIRKYLIATHSFLNRRTSEMSLEEIAK